MRIFVYGTLRSDDTSGWHQKLIAPTGRCLGRGRVAGRLYDLGSYPGLKPPHFRCDHVRGEVWALPDSQLPAVDCYEGTLPYVRPPAEFRRDRALVRMDDGRLLSAWVYYHLPRRLPEGARLILSGDYLAR